MPQLSIAQLAEIVDGQLALGAMPPLGGGLEPIGRIVTCSEEVEPGSVFWATQTDEDGALESVMEAMLQAAQGVVTPGRYVEPWAGRFCICVEDGSKALADLAGWARRQFTGPVVGVCSGAIETGAEPCLTELLLGKVLDDASHGAVRRDAHAMALSMLRWSDDSDCAILNLSSLSASEISKISHLCSPEIIAINSLHKTNQRSSTRDQQAFAETQSRFLQSLPRSAILVLNGDDQELRGMASTRSIETIVIGCESDSDVTAGNVDCRGNRLSFDVEGVRFEFPGWELRHLPQALSGIVIGKLMMLPLESLQGAAREVARPSRGNVAA